MLANGGNLVFSPASIAAALRMALCGARGRTAAEIAAALHLARPAEAADGLRLLSQSLPGLPRDGVVLRAPNTMWVRAGLPLLPSFTETLRAAAAVSVRDADFAHACEKARAEINDLVAKQTEGRITGLLPPGSLDETAVLVLVNALYLNAAWACPFPERATRDAPFYPGGPVTGAPVTARMMRLTHELPYLRGDGYQAVVLPYRGGRLTMTVVLPDARLDELPPGLTADLAQIPGRAHRRRVTLALPKFRQEGGLDLIPVLRRLGVREAFGAGADFTGITAMAGLSISAAVHRAFVNVDEQGTEAAAATAIVASRMAAVRPHQPVTMTVDHPFLFAITDTATGLPLFLGQVVRPTGG